MKSSQETHRKIRKTRVFAAKTAVKNKFVSLSRITRDIFLPLEASGQRNMQYLIFYASGRVAENTVRLSFLSYVSVPCIDSTADLAKNKPSPE